MISKTITPRFLTLSGFVFLAALIRLIPHPPNFAPIAAVALFGGAYFNKKWAAFLVPLLAMFITDLILGFHATMWAVYISFVLIVGLGMLMIKQKNVINVFLASVSASVLFFIITNFGLWISTPYYAKTGEGLAACFTAAIPFFHHTLLGDLFFAAVIFGLYELVKAKITQLKEA